MRGLGIAATAGITGLAGCSGGGDDSGNEAMGTGTSDGSDDDSDTTDSDTTDSGSSGGSSDSFEYSFGSNDDVVGSSLLGVRMSYPDGSGAVSNAEVASATLAGQDVTDDLDGSSTSNNDTTVTANFGGAYDISADDTLMIELGSVDAPDGSYTVETVVNPQSGQTTFETSF